MSAADAEDAEDVSVHRFFDGAAWWENVIIHVRAGRIADVSRGGGHADRSVGFVVPGLVDCHVRIYGYSEVPEADPLGPERRFLEMAWGEGVMHVVDVELDQTSIVSLRTGSEHRSAPVVHGIGPCASVCGRSRFDLRVDPDREQREAWRLWALQPRTSLAARSVCGCALALIPQDCRLDAPTRLFVRSCDATALARWNDSEGSTRVVCVGRERAAVSTIEGLLTSTIASRAATILPFTGRLAGAGSTTALFIAKKAARRYMPPAMSERLSTQQVTELEEEIAQRDVVVGTGASQPGAVPGHSVWTEMAHVERVRGSFDDALHAATGATSWIFQDDAGVGQLKAGSPAAWLEGSGLPRTVAELRGGLRRMVRGQEATSYEPDRGGR